MSEIRTIRSSELRAADDGDFAIVGRAIKYNSLSHDLGGFVEKIAPGAFKASLADSSQDVKALVNHNADRILGRLKNRTLTLSDGADGLRFRVQLDRNQQAHRDVYASVQRGDLAECSFCFIDAVSDWDYSQQPPVRTVRSAKLLDVSVVTEPAYGNNATSAEARKEARKFGYSRKTTVAADSFSIEMMRKATRAMLAPKKREAGLNQEAFDLIGAHLQRCSEMAEDLFAGAGTLDDLFNSDTMGDDFWNDDWNDDTGDDDDGMERSYRQTARSFRDSIRKMRAHANLAARRLAAMRLHHSKLADALGRKG